jgi:hypothetical protein
MDNSKPNLPERDAEPKPEGISEGMSETESKPEEQAVNLPETEPKPDEWSGDTAETEPKPDEWSGDTAETEPKPDEWSGDTEETEPKPDEWSEGIAETETEGYVNEHIKKAYERVKAWFGDAREHYERSPRLQKTTYQGKYLPAFWTVACIFSLIVNIILLAILISLGHNFFELKSVIANGLINGTSENLALMDKAHIVTTVPVNTSVQLQDTLPVVFDLPINQSTQLSLAQDTRITGAYIYLNNTAVLTDLTLPANTPIQANFDINIPVNTTVPLSITVPVSIQMPVDIAIDQTDLHQSIVGLQGIIEPYKALMGSSFNSPKDFSMCEQWWSGWMCGIFFGEQ